MDRSECRVGLRVRLREDFYGTSNQSGAVSSGLTLPAGATGRVVRDSSGRASVSVEFDRPFKGGHDCWGAARDGHGWNIVPEALDPVAAQAPAAQATPKPWPQAEQVASLARSRAERAHLAEAARDEALRQVEALRATRAAELAAAREEGRAEARRELLAEVARVRAAKLGAQANGCGGRFAGLEADDEPSARDGAN